MEMKLENNLQNIFEYKAPTFQLDAVNCCNIYNSYTDIDYHGSQSN